jgi:deoxyribonucleoside regulator
MQSDSNEQLHLAARLYYVDGWDQAKVAELVRVSQAKVSRLLSLARKRGIVRITVADYDARQRLLENELISRLGLKTAIVIKSMEDLPASKVREITAHFAAPLIESLIPPGSVMALSGGLSLQNIIHQLPITSHAPTVVQAVGQMGSNINLWDAQELGRSVAEKWHGKFLLLNAPVYLPNKTAYEAMLKLEQIQHLKQKTKEIAVALVEIRAARQSLFVDSLGKVERDQLEQAHAVGEICGRYYDNHGNECETSLKSQSLSIEFETLRQIPQTIGVVTGQDDAIAALAAIRGSLVKSLITDESTARTMLGLINNDLTEKKASLHYHLS